MQNPESAQKNFKKSQIKKIPRNLNLRISKKLDSNFFPTFSLPWNFSLGNPHFEETFTKDGDVHDKLESR